HAHPHRVHAGVGARVRLDLEDLLGVAQLSFQLGPVGHSPTSISLAMMGSLDRAFSGPVALTHIRTLPRVCIFFIMSFAMAASLPPRFSMLASTLLRYSTWPCCARRPGPISREPSRPAPPFASTTCSTPPSSNTRSRVPDPAPVKRTLEPANSRLIT